MGVVMDKVEGEGRRSDGRVVMDRGFGEEGGGRERRKKQSRQGLCWVDWCVYCSARLLE